VFVLFKRLQEKGHLQAWSPWMHGCIHNSSGIKINTVLGDE